MNSIDECPFCGEQVKAIQYMVKKGPPLYRIECVRCRPYVAELLEVAMIPWHRRDPLLAKKVRRRLYELQDKRNILITAQPQEGAVVGVDYATSLEEIRMKYEDDGSPLEKYENTIVNLASRGDTFGHEFNSMDDRWVVPTMDDEEARAIIDGLFTNGYVDGSQAWDGSEYSLTVDGLQYAAELRREARASGEIVFIAACFKDELEEARGTIDRVVREWGYDPKAVDRDCRDKLIDLNIYELIRESKFVVADLTWNRQSVYYEVGFAHGLGLEVVLTCRSDHFKNARNDFKRVHFDLNHRPVIKWENEGHLAQELGKRIGQDFGRGPIIEQQKEEE